MKFEATKTFGWEGALIGMRLPMSLNYEDAKRKSDSVFFNESILKLGESDLKILKNLIKADDIPGKSGQPNSKVLRMIGVQVAITAPLYWWSEFDTYGVGVTKNSTSKMHKLASTPITMDCFETDDFSEINIESEDFTFPLSSTWKSIIDDLESLRQKYNETKDKRYWKELIRLLPESWLQTRMVNFNYQSLRNMFSWRDNHKLNEWSGKDKSGVENFVDWVKTLPYAKDLIVGGNENE